MATEEQILTGFRVPALALVGDETPPLDDTPDPHDSSAPEDADVDAAAARQNGSRGPGEDARGDVRRPYRLYSAAELDELPDATWIVENAIPENGLVGVIGAKGQLKTFVVLDLALHVGTGTEWHGRTVKRGGVVYIYAEGPFGAKARVDAWCKYHSYLRGAPVDRSALDISFLPTRIAMNRPGAVAALIVEICNVFELVSVVVIDTLNQNIDGDEDGKGMSGFVAGCSQLREALGATVIAVHHTPQSNDDRARGHGAFDGALDTRFIVSRDADRVTLECTHQRNGIDGWSVAFEAIPVAGSLVLKPSALTGGKLSGQRRKCLEVLHQEGTASYSVWLKATELGASSFRKARSWLLDMAYVNVKKRQYTATESGVAALGHQGHSEGHHE